MQVELENRVITERELGLFLHFVKRHKNLDLSSYRKTFLLRRLKIRMDGARIENLGRYISLLKKDPQEWRRFLDNLNINISEFFRDLSVFFQFQRLCIPELIRNKQKNKQKTIRCWSCGCSCGEEPYSLAITFKELLKERIKDFVITIWATDVDEDALQKAEKGEYSERSLRKVSKEILIKHFIQTSEKSYKVKDEIKKMVIFKKHDILNQSPLRNMDVIFFRNLKIYLDASKSQEILLEMYKSLKKEGYLVLGKVESLDLSLRENFVPVDLINKIFRKKKRR